MMRDRHPPLHYILNSTPMKTIKAIESFYGSYDEGLVLPGTQLNVTNSRAAELEKLNLIEILGDATEVPASKPIIDPNQTTPILDIDPIVNRDDIEQKHPIGGKDGAEAGKGKTSAEKEEKAAPNTKEDKAKTQTKEKK